MEEIQVKNLMTPEVIGAAIDANLGDVIKQMAKKRRSCMVVTNADIPVGIITERDIVQMIGQGLNAMDNGYTRIGDLMTSPPVTIDENATLFEALVVSRSHNIRHIPVVNDSGEPTDIITQK